MLLGFHSAVLVAIVLNGVVADLVVVGAERRRERGGIATGAPILTLLISGMSGAIFLSA